MGYAGGNKKNPNYHDLGDHSETIQIDFDSRQITYNELLDIFWDSHNPVSRPYSRQYMSIIFYHNEEQREQAHRSKEKIQQATKRKIFTEIVPASVFYFAESYHQKYYLRGISGLIMEFRNIYKDDKDLINSTAATRVNGYIGGYGSLSRLDKEIDSFGLSAYGSRLLTEIVRVREDRAAARS